MHPGLQKLVGLEIASVVFVRGYLQLCFDGPTLSIYSMPSVTTAAGTFHAPRTPGYADALITAINKTVVAADSDEQSLTIRCRDGCSIRVPLDDASLVNDEAAMLSLEHIVYVW